MKVVIISIISLFLSLSIYANPITGLLERIDAGASKKFVIERINSSDDFFELDQKGSKVVVRGNDYVSIAAGINWYLKYYAGIHLSWNGMTADLPETLPAVTKKERYSTTQTLRYNLNYCTHSYTMAFWDWQRWEQEIDWMALHGINLPLAITGTETVWYNVLDRLGYSKDEINEFIAGPAFQAWFLMNNLEGWGGANPDSWYEQRAELQKKIVSRMKEFDIEPIFAGYSGMVPNNSKERLGLDVSDPGLWCSYKRPAFLLPTDENFDRIATIYYQELEKLYGKANYYSMDPFHEGGHIGGVDLDAAGKAIMKQMKATNPDAKWVAQAWQANPYDQMIKNLDAGDIIVVDLFSESRPQWGDPKSTWNRKDGYGKHSWIYSMLLNFGGNVGLHGKMQHVINSFYTAKSGVKGSTLVGVGLSMEGAENNAVMYELASELPWREQKFDKDEWLRNYCFARYGENNEQIEQAWIKLSNSIYNCPPQSTQQGTTESIFCARPSLDAYQASSWSEMTDYYDPKEVIDAAREYISVADKFKGNNNYEHDLVDITRQAIAEKGRMILATLKSCYNAQDKLGFEMAKKEFLSLILLQDQLLSTRKEFEVGTWIEKAKNLGTTTSEKKLYEWNARVQITTWGNRKASEDGGLRDYAHREWSGILRDLYYVRWEMYLDNLSSQLNGEPAKEIDFYLVDEKWANDTNIYDSSDSPDVVSTAQNIFNIVFNN